MHPIYILAGILLACVVAATGCSDKETEYRAVMCKKAGVPRELIDRCKATTEDYDQIMEEEVARREEEELAIFHETLANLPPRRTPDHHQYEAISLKDLSMKVDKILLWRILRNSRCYK
jgi:hypothetical protein